MHSKKTGIKGLILILAGLVALAAIAVVPTFGGGTTHAGPAGGINLNKSAAVTEFIIPGVPVGTLAAPLGTGQAPIVATLTGNTVADTFPVKDGELLIGKTELVVWDNNSTACGALGPQDICITERAKVGEKKNHAAGNRVQIATQLTAPINDTTDAVQCDLKAAISATSDPSATNIALQCGTGQAAAFGATGFLTVAHSGTVLGLSSEYLEYDNSGTCTLAADQLCLVNRALQPGNDKRAHLADGFNQPCTTNPNDGITCTDGKTQGVSIVTKQFQLTVKSNDGFFPAGPLVVYSIDGGNNIVGSEIINFNNAADKIKTPPSTQFHATTRGGFTATLSPTAISSHAAGSIVTGAHAQLVCRNGNVQPGVDTQPGEANPGVQEPPTQLAGTSVASYPVCQTRTQPDAAPKTFPAKKLSIPTIGSTLIVLNAVGVPFLSTGGLFDTVFGDIDLVDPNGTDDGELVLTSPCIENFTPGTNLKVDVTLDTSANDHTIPSVGTITVVLDTIPEGPGTLHEACDDPAGQGIIVSKTYSFYEPTNAEGTGTCADTLDNDGDLKADIADPDCYNLANGATTHDTDGDGCGDVEELNPNAAKGGLRDPWNGNDYYDVNGDGDIDVPNDILQVILAYLQSSGDPQYTVAKDRGGAFGPFAQNRGEADDIIEVPNDILPVILQYLNNCTDGP